MTTHPDTHILAYPETQLPPRLKAGVIEVLEGAWPTTRTREERLARPLADARYEPICMLLVEGERDAGSATDLAAAAAADDAGLTVLAYLVILTKTIEHAGHTYRASGLSAVSTLPTRRGEGLAGRLVRAAFEHITDRGGSADVGGVDLGIFTCDEPLARFYAERGADLGWAVMPSTVVVGGTRSRPFRADTLRNERGEGKATLMAFLSSAARANRGSFEGTPEQPRDVYLDLREGDLW